MSNISQTTGKQSINVGISGATNSKITNLSLAVKDTEYNHSLTTNLKNVIIRCRTMADLKFSFVSGESATKYFSIPSGCSLSISDLDFVSKTLYLQASKDSVIVEILELY